MPKSTVFLTFDDGPLSGSDDVIQVLKTKKVKGTLFMVGVHVTSTWRKNQVIAAHVSPYCEVGNHSNTHADEKYASYYSDPKTVVEGFKEATKILDIKGTRIITRLPGRNTWRVGNIIKNDLESGNAADLLYKEGYVIYGWDVEWKMTKTGMPVESPEEMVKKIQNALLSDATKKKNKVIVLMHDAMFKTSTGEKAKSTTSGKAGGLYWEPLKAVIKA
ncbi:MAG: polysaccharide deacetylase family protein [Desulfobacteraceae bacterium]|nr:polysaccharide deacetylase family protein [Desulfobacteraceae bacterium]